jgi:hypothetical protein
LVLNGAEFGLGSRADRVALLVDVPVEQAKRTPVECVGDYATFVDRASIIVLASVLGLLLTIQASAWIFGYRKSLADEAEGA